MPHPPLKPRPTGTFALAGHRKGERCWSRLILGRQLPQEDAASTRTKVRRPADEKGVDVEGASWSQAESSAMKTSAPRRISRPSANPPPETMMMGIGKIATSPESR